jgi:hypothetical protein
MNIKGFFVTALSQALDLGMASPDDVLRHVTPELLAESLPRPLWARLLTACLGAPRVDAQLVVETIGVPNLCEHLPSAVIWNCISEIALRSLGREFVPIAVPTHSSLGSGPVMTRPAPLAMTPPPEERPREAPAPRPVAVGPAIPAALPTPAASDSLADVVAALENDDRPAAPSRARTPTSQRFRQANTGIGRLAANNTRRPQAATTPTETVPPVATSGSPARSHRRGSTEVTDYDLETDIKDDWKSSLAVEDEQPMVDWSGNSEETQNTDEFGRKR